ncbi:MAG: GNAT family N-acetyltransferase [archaeon]
METDFKELKEIDLNTVSQVHALFPHWKRASVQRKLDSTQKNKDQRFIALVKGKIVAHVKVVYGQGLHKHRAEITSLVVDKKMRKHHIGSGLMKFVLANISSKTFLVLLAVETTNKPAIKLYKKLGFEKYGLLKKASLVNGKFVDNILMKKELK